MKGKRRERKPRRRAQSRGEPSALLAAHPNPHPTRPRLATARAQSRRAEAPDGAELRASVNLANPSILPPPSWPRPRPVADARGRARGSCHLGAGRRRAAHVRYSGQSHVFSASRAPPPLEREHSRLWLLGFPTLWGWRREVAYGVASGCLRAGHRPESAVQSHRAPFPPSGSGDPSIPPQAWGLSRASVGFLQWWEGRRTLFLCPPTPPFFSVKLMPLKKQTSPLSFSGSIHYVN